MMEHATKRKGAYLWRGTARVRLVLLLPRLRGLTVNTALELRRHCGATMETHITTRCALPLARRWITTARCASLVCCGEFAGKLYGNVSTRGMTLTPARRGGSEG